MKIDSEVPTSKILPNFKLLAFNAFVLVITFTVLAFFPHKQQRFDLQNRKPIHTKYEKPVSWHDSTKTVPFQSSDFHPNSIIITYLITQEKREPNPKVLTCKQKPHEYDILCRIGLTAQCYSRGPADVVNDFWAVEPLYAYDQEMSAGLYSLHNNFRDYIKSFGLSFCTIEGIRKDLNQTYIATTAGNEPYEIQVTIYDEDYIRENLINVAVKKIKAPWEYLAWIDAHQIFENIYWWEESIIKMEKFSSLHLYRSVLRLGQDNLTLEVKPGAICLSMVQYDIDIGPYKEFGLAFSARREIFERIGGLLDVCIASGCDISYVEALVPDEVKFEMLDTTPNYSKNFMPWINNAKSVFKGSRSYVRGDIYHFSHLKYFRYGDAGGAFDTAKYSAETDIVRDENSTIKIINPMIRRIIPDLDFKYFTGA